MYLYIGSHFGYPRLECSRTFQNIRCETIDIFGYQLFSEGRFSGAETRRSSQHLTQSATGLDLDFDRVYESYRYEGQKSTFSFTFSDLKLDVTTTCYICLNWFFQELQDGVYFHTF